MADKPFALSSMDNARTFLITREHNPAHQPTVEYEQAYVSTANQITVQKTVADPSDYKAAYLPTNYAQISKSKTSGIRTSVHFDCHLG
ncbi:hypothetical protein T03_6723 [Trichinella britovi]|uniref:Uncharacterized protein n=1 Tax=Trichinella britovi TaxID=45882 RepID=A0A0V1ANZ0_TRIBR|nr:hypothetical protein T03_6723 [Trichinella britovi]